MERVRVREKATGRDRKWESERDEGSERGKVRKQAVES